MRREARVVSQEARWVTNLKKALVKAGVTVDAIAGVIQRAMEAERLGVGEDGEVVSLGDHHVVQLKGAGMAIELHVPRRAGQLDAARPMLHIQAGAKVQLMFFGEVMPQGLPTQGPAEMSAEMRNHLIRQGKLNPDGSVPAPAEAKRESPKALPEPNRKRDGWVRE